MQKRVLYWLITLSMVTHSLSFAMGSHAGGIWTVSCAGKPLFLPIPEYVSKGHTTENAQTHCPYCCWESPDSADGFFALRAWQNLVDASRLNAVSAITCFSHASLCHPPRAPPAVH